MTDPTEPAQPSSPGPPAPAPLTVAASLAGVEGVLLVLYGVVELFVVSADKAAMGVTTAVFFLIYGAGLAYCAATMWRLHSWARSPVVMAQLIQLGVAWSFWGGGTTVLAVAIGIGALIVLAGIFHPASLAALGDEQHHREQP